MLPNVKENTYVLIYLSLFSKSQHKLDEPFK